MHPACHRRSPACPPSHRSATALRAASIGDRRPRRERHQPEEPAPAGRRRPRDENKCPARRRRRPDGWDTGRPAPAQRRPETPSGHSSREARKHRARRGGRRRNRRTAAPNDDIICLRAPPANPIGNLTTPADGGAWGPPTVARRLVHFHPSFSRAYLGRFGTGIPNAKMCGF